MRNSLVIAALVLSLVAHAEDVYQIGLARVDITPTTPIRLCGYAARKNESEGVDQRIFAKALAIGEDNNVVVLLTVDNTGIPQNITDEVAARLAKKINMPRERFAINSSHTHTGPCVYGNLPNMFGAPIPAEHQLRIQRYTQELIDNLEKVSLEAVGNRKPGKLAYAPGTAPFAANRRTKGGPTDRTLLVMRVTAHDGKLRGILVNYACHCTTLVGDHNKISGDWSGFSQEYIERDNPGIIAMVTIGCGADQNPEPRGKLEHVQQHGESIAKEVARLVKTENEHKSFWTPLTAPITPKLKRIELPFDKIPDRATWEERAKKPDAAGGNARIQLARLDKDGKLAESVPYDVQTWSFGEQFGMVFLPGEVVIDYVLRLKEEFQADKIWVNAYSNDVPAYIPSKRILNEGGYEAEGAMTYYAHPTRFAPAVENLIIRTIHEQLPVKLRNPKSLEQYPPPKTPENSKQCIQTRPQMNVELVAAEPLIEDPVAIDWGIDGKLWVAEMHDFPNGLHENMTPGGRVKLLEDVDGDGKYDKATVFIDKIMYPTGVMAWRKGVLICSAPDIIYAEDTDGDGKADVRKTLFSGFSPQNEQWEVNGLSWGLDNWVYGASSVVNQPIKVAATGKFITLGNRDFRMNPDTGDFEAASGRTQFGRVRDDWGNWFGNDNSNLLWHYPLPDHYARRNPYVAAPPPAVYVPADADSRKLFPASRTLERFNDLTHVNRVTSACSPCIYRDDLLGKEFYGNAFVCEPVHNLVHRLILEPDGVTFKGHRAPENKESEFLASTDNWFRPVQVRTGPDGALWVVDMYRYVVEHPRWIPPTRLSKLDVRAGENMGRIYRVFPANAKPRAIENLSKLSAEELAKKIDSPNGTLRDTIHRELVQRQDKECVSILASLVRNGKSAASRSQAMCALQGLSALDNDTVFDALADGDVNLRIQALRFAETNFANNKTLREGLMGYHSDPSIRVRFQLILSLGEWNYSITELYLGRMAVLERLDTWMRAAILSSASKNAVEVLQRAIQEQVAGAHDTELIRKLTYTAAMTSNDIARIIELIRPEKDVRITDWQFTAVRNLLEACDRRNIDISKIDRNERIAFVLQSARDIVRNKAADEDARLEALQMLAHDEATLDDDLLLLSSLLNSRNSSKLQSGALKAMIRSGSASVPKFVLYDWPMLSPAMRSAVLDAMLARPEWRLPLLTAIEKKAIAANEIDAAHRAQILGLEEPILKQLAGFLFQSVSNPDRKKVIEDLGAALTLPGNAANGAAVFGKTCATCHAFGGQGTAAGPDLAALTDRSPQALMIAMFDPNAAVDGKFISYVVTLNDGRALTGMVADETANALTIIQSTGARETVLRSDIRKLKSSGLSLMPEGLEATLKAQDVADIIAHLRGSTPGKRREFDGNKPEVVKAAADGSLKLLPATGEIYGTTIALEKQYGNLGMWSSQSDQAVWAVEIPKDGKYEVFLEYACDSNSAGNKFMLEVGDANLTGTVAGTATGNWDNYRRVSFGTITIIKGGTQRAALRAAGPIKGALMDLRAVELRPQTGANGGK